MTYIVFENKGEIDPRAITAFGISSKECDNPIGRFGTGLKYAIALLLRNKQEIIITSGKKIFRFGSRTLQIRNDTFQLVTMNGDTLGFTTAVGRDWLLWQAYREIYSNAIDEGGRVYTQLSEPEPEEGKTFVIVKGQDFLDIHNNRGEIFLQTTPSSVVDGLEIHPGQSNFVFYRGIRIFGPIAKKYAHTYNITGHIDLTEDRTALYGFQIERAIVNGLALCKEPGIIRAAVMNTHDRAEASYNFMDANVDPGAAFNEVTGELRLDRSDSVNRSAVMLFEKGARASVPESIAVTLEPRHQAMLDTAKEFLGRMGVQTKKYPIFVVETLGSGILGLAENGKIYLSLAIFDKGTKMVALGLLEEYTHLQTGYGDMTRGLQTFLFDTILSLGESYVWKRPLEDAA